MEKLPDNGVPHVKRAIHAILSEIRAIGKDRRNEQQGYKFRGIEDVINALQPLLDKNEIFIAPGKIVERGMTEVATKSGGTLLITNLNVLYRFESVRDNSTYEVEVAGEGGDSADKGVNKAMSSAYKNMAFQLFCIRTDSAQDSEEDSEEASGSAQPARQVGGQRAPRRSNAPPCVHCGDANETIKSKKKEGYYCFACRGEFTDADVAVGAGIT